MPLFACAALLFLVGSLTNGCGPRLLPERPPDNYKVSIVEGPTLGMEDYWIYQRPDGSRIKLGAGNLLYHVEFPLWVGRVWRLPSTASLLRQPQGTRSIPVEIECFAAAFEPITLKAGEFEAFECRCQCMIAGAAGGYEPDCGRWTFWYAPRAKNIVSIITESTTGSAELIEYKVSESKVFQERTKPLTTPANAVTFYNRGNAYRRNQDYDRAIQNYNDAIRLNPAYASAFNNRGIAYVNKRDYDRAIEDYNEAIRINPNYARAFNNRGNAYRSKGDHDRAIEDHDEAIRIDPNYASAFNNRGNAYKLKQNYERAIKDYDQAIRSNPSYAYAFQGRGIAKFFQERPDAAVSDFSKAAELQPANLYHLLWLYLAEARAGHDGLANLQSLSQELDLGKWPGPVINFYLDKFNESALLAAAQNPDPKLRSEQICEANFYTAEANLLQNALTEALPLLRAAEKDCPPNFIESHAATAELKRLGY